VWCRRREPGSRTLRMRAPARPLCARPAHARRGRAGARIRRVREPGTRQRHHTVLHPGEGRHHCWGLADHSRDHEPITLRKGSLMKHRHWSRLALVALAAAAPAAAAPGPAAAATAYLQARTAAVTAADPGAVLATWTAPAGTLTATERTVARGTALRAAQLGHRIDSVGSETTVLGTAPGATRDTATVSAHVILSLIHISEPTRRTPIS